MRTTPPLKRTTLVKSLLFCWHCLASNIAGYRYCIAAPAKRHRVVPPYQYHMSACACHPALSLQWSQPQLDSIRCRGATWYLSRPLFSSAEMKSLGSCRPAHEHLRLTASWGHFAASHRIEVSAVSDESADTVRICSEIKP